jgi:hypothetical protein
VLPFDCIGRSSRLDASCVRVRHHARMSNGSEGKDVLSSLPRSRPQRRSAKRQSAGARKPTAPATPKPKPTPKAATKPKVTGAARPSAATRRAREDTAKPPPRAEAVPPANRDIVTTTVQAAGELARIGLAVGTQIVREAVRRVPKP